MRQCLGATVLACSALAILIWLILSSMSPSTNHLFPIQNLDNSFIVKLVIFFSIFTSQFISLFNLDTAMRGEEDKTSKDKTSQARYLRLAMFCAIAFFLGSFGFSQLVSHVYPWIGLFMVAFLTCALLWSYFFSRIRRHQVPPT